MRLNLADEAAVRQAFVEIQQRVAQDGKLAEMDGMLIQPMISEGVELMVGMTLDSLFGPLTGFGLGGIHVEILEDVCFRVTPITDRDAAEMVRAIKGFRLLEGYRGHPPADLPAVENLLLRVARLVEEVPEIAELDLNPVIALPPGRGCQIVDARHSGCIRDVGAGWSTECSKSIERSFHNQYRTIRIAQRSLRDTAEQQAAQSGSTVTPHDDH